MVRQIYRGCDRVLIQSPGFRQPIEKQAVPPNKIVEFPNWAESLYEPVELPEDAPERTELPEGFRILFAGNIGTSQSFPTILQAAELCRDEAELKWVILGDGREKASVEQEVKSRGLENIVHLLGRRPVESMPRYFAAADVLLLTLKRDPAFARVIPSKLQSYLACGKPVLGGLDGDGASVISESHAGLVVPAEDAQTLATAARRMLHSSPEERIQWGQNGLRYSQDHFNRQGLIDHLEELFREVTGIPQAIHFPANDLGRCA
jgi:glycosyltransferase involved in cell wall biosynthesis